jgi:hypothetical protein
VDNHLGISYLPVKQRVKVEHAICDLKHYKIIGTLWRHPRRKLKKFVELCGAFVRRLQTLLKTCIKVSDVYGHLKGIIHC